MQTQPPNPVPAPRPASFTVELGPIAHAVGRELCGQVPAERIEQLLRDLLEQEFSAARVTTFLPIFLHRYACATLRENLRENLHENLRTDAQGRARDGAA